MGKLLIAEVRSEPHFPLVLQTLENQLVSARFPNCFLVFIQRLGATHSPMGAFDSCFSLE